MASAIQATKAPARKGSLACYRWYPKVSRIQAKAAQDVGRGSETLMTFARGDLFKAARRFVSGESRKALVVTGFYIPKAEHPAAESDGPVGATEICAAIRDIGGDAWLVSDAWCEPVIRGAAKDVLPQDHVLIAPKGDSFDAWLDGTKTLIAEQHIDTVIFIERVGPASDGYPRNMRGINILEWTAPLSRLASLGLLLPPFLRYGLQETLPAVVAFIVICEAIICSVGPSNAKKYFHIGSFTFVFWTRSFGLIGMIVGYAAAILLFDIMKIAIDFDILLIMFAAYAILCLTVAVMLGRIGLKAPAERERESTPAAAAHALAERYGLTAREAEVLELVAQGRNMTYVQKALCISPGTSSTHINHIHQKLDVHSREELIDLVQEELAR